MHEFQPNFEAMILEDRATKERKKNTNYYIRYDFGRVHKIL